MLAIRDSHPTIDNLLSYLEEFELYCMGKTRLSPEKFRLINQELSIGTVFMVGEHRYKNTEHGKQLIWKSLDNKEYDLGIINNSNVMRDFPGFHAQKSRSLSAGLVKDNITVESPGKHKNISIVTLKDGTVGIGLNYRTALRNAALRMHIKTKFNRFSLAKLWGSIWGTA